MHLTTLNDIDNRKIKLIGRALYVLLVFARFTPFGSTFTPLLVTNHFRQVHRMIQNDPEP